MMLELFMWKTESSASSIITDRGPKIYTLLSEDIFDLYSFSTEDVFMKRVSII